jgi:integrase
VSAAPSERFLASIERELKKEAPHTQRAVGGGIYMSLDRDRRRRFQFRARRGGAQRAGTFDSWDEAVEALEGCADGALAEAVGAAEASAEQLREWKIALYAQEWWRHVLTLDVRTQDDYRRALKHLLPLVEDVTLAQLETAPLLVDVIKDRIAAAKTYAPKKGQQPKLHKAAADKLLKALRMICQHALERRILTRNPVAGIPNFNRPRAAAGDHDAPSHRPILRSEVKTPRMVVLTGVGMRGNPATLAARRLVPELIATGMRPSDILAMRHRWWRDEDGPLDYIHIDSAVKDIAGHLLEGEPKTGERDLTLFPAIAEALERIYQLQDRPDLDALVVPNRHGDLLDWGNFTTEVWYPSLYRGGVSKAPTATARGAFNPYLVRHVGVTVMLHAERPEGGTYSRHEVARQFGHTVQTLDRVYADIPEDMHGIADMTMDEILRTARRSIWGPMPGDDDYEPIEYELLDARELTGMSVNALAARLQRGSLPGVKRRGKWYVTRFDLAWHGLIPPPGLPTRRTPHER